MVSEPVWKRKPVPWCDGAVTIEAIVQASQATTELWGWSCSIWVVPIHLGAMVILAIFTTAHMEH